MKKRHEGTRWSLLYGIYEDVEKFAVEEAQRYFQSYLPYVMRVERAGKNGSATPEKLAGHLIVVGTKENNQLAAQLIDKGHIEQPKGPEGYTLKCMESPWNPGSRMVAVVGADAAGVLYGVEPLGLTILPDLVAPPNPAKVREHIDNLPFFVVSERPKIANRGIWTWGYVIYDYRRFIDNMARLRMNMLTIWNDELPVNIPAVVAYAHSRGVKVILGFEWGWGKDELDLSNKDDRSKIRDAVIGRYERDYAGLGIDGIYFQTLTEHFDKVKGSVSVAASAKELVNETAGELLSKHPGLLIQFGLHATSIGDRYEELAELDPRVTIVWEDAGDIPFSYRLAPGQDASYRKPEPWVVSPEKTLEYSMRLAAIRGGKDEFAIVPKGWTCLDWDAEFENHESFILGARDAGWIHRRLELKRLHWDKVNALWLKHYKIAIHYYREMLKSHHGPMTACALIEDGMFEAEVQTSVAIFAGTVWEPCRTEEETLQEAYMASATLSRLKREHE
jgi:hypothetical protein